MSLQLFYPSSFLSFLLFLFAVLIKIQLSLSNPGMYVDCLNEFRCGNIKAGYPFWGFGPANRTAFCGHPKLQLHCEGDTTTMMINYVKFAVLNIAEETQVLKIRRWDFRDICPPDLTGLLNTTIDSELFEYSGGYKNLTLLYAIPKGEHTCFPGHIDYKNGTVRPIKSSSPISFNITIPVLGTLLSAAKDSPLDLEKALEEGFELILKVNGLCDKCIESKGSCGYNRWSNKFACYCPNDPFVSTEECPRSPAAQAPQHGQGLSGTLLNFRAVLITISKYALNAN